MKLTVLGGSAAGCNTGAGCSGYLVDCGNARHVLDLGPGTFQELRKHANFRQLDAVVISHLHLDHVLDLAALRFALAHNPVEPEARLRLWLPPGGRGFLTTLAAAFAEDGKESDFFPAVFDVAEYDPSIPLDIGEVRFRFAPTVHYVPCWAMRVSWSETHGDLFYTADAGPASALGRLAAGCSVIVAEATLQQPSDEPFESRGHLTAREAATLARDAGAHTLLITHLWEELGFAEYRSLAASAFTGRLEIARPGLTVEW